MNTAKEVDNSRRRFLTQSANAVGAVGAVFVAVPFLASWAPSERAQAAGAPVEADISKLEPGAIMTVEYRGTPVFITRRTEEMLATLPEVRDQLRDPDSSESDQPEYATNDHRSRKPEHMVMVGVCTHLGCAPQYHPAAGDPTVGADWAGGFFCPCHGSKFDFAGRVYRGVPAPVNLVVPDYSYISDSLMMIGEDTQEETT